MAQSVGVSLGAVASVATRARLTGVTWPDVEGLPDDALEQQSEIIVIGRRPKSVTCRALTLAFAVTVTTALAGCAGIQPLRAVAAEVPQAGAACRTALGGSDLAAAPTIVWLQPGPAHDRVALESWCRATGRPVIASRPARVGAGIAPLNDELAVVSWNLHVGTADLAAMVGALRAGHLTGGRPVTRFVLLLQEAYRDDDSVPVDLTPGLAFASALGRLSHGDRERTDVVALARALDLALYYAPSMRNGAPSETREDRGNAILSTEPLSDLTAIELPFERQRRVAVAATVTSRDPAGEPFNFRVASVHLESTGSARRLWLMVSGARVRQARGLLEALRPHERLIVGGDFNTWFGFSDETYHTVAAELTDASAGDRRRTFGGIFRLDHLFSKMPDGWSVQARRLDNRWGSDHYPLLARLRRGAAVTAATTSVSTAVPAPLALLCKPECRPLNSTAPHP